MKTKFENDEETLIRNHTCSTCSMWLMVAACCLGLSSVGCTDKSQSTNPQSTAIDLSTPLSDMRSAVRAQNWTKADLYSQAVQDRYGEDAEAMVLVAQVAHFNGRPDQSAELMMRAVKLETLGNEARIKQCVIALVGAGRLFDAIDLLDEAVKSHPDQMESRRLLFDLCMGSEMRQRALTHGHFLVRQRRFDLEMLMDLTNGERRTADSKPLDQMVERNPDDLRPKIGTARAHFDKREFTESQKLCEQIIEKHPHFTPANLLLARCLSFQGNKQQFEHWLSQLSDDLSEEPDYWISIGTYAESIRDHEQSARAFWEAIRLDPDRSEAWTSLLRELQLIDAAKQTQWSVAIDPIQRRLGELSKLQQQRDRFDRTGRNSRQVASEIVDTLDRLGRMWEAEAWAAVATSFPEDPSIDLQAQRKRIVAQLTLETPWQLVTRHPELSWDGSQLPLPAIVNRKSTQVTPDSPSKLKLDSDGQPSITVLLTDEAAERGVKFDAMPASDLNQPGILLYKTLGCGGGAIDFNLDGWHDLYFATAGGTPPAKDSLPNALYRNVQGKFDLVTEATGTGDRGFSQGVIVSDVNQDGFPDLLVLNYGPNTLYMNQGDGTFQDASHLIQPADPKLDQIAWSTCAAVADFNSDGLCDLAVANYCAGLSPITTPCGNDTDAVSYACSPMKFPALADQFYEGLPDGTWIEATSKWAATPDIPGRGLGMVAADLDGAAGIELYVANDMTSNHYWSPKKEAQNEFQLIESALPRGLAGDERMAAQGSMGIALGDFDRDQDADLYVTNFHGEYNTYYDQLEPGLWRDRTAPMKLVAPALPLVGFGTQAVDFDRDGRDELVVTNGHVDLFSREGRKAEYAQPMQIFFYHGQGYQLAGSNSGYTAARHVGRSLWKMDIDLDHQVDLVVTHQTEPVALLMNQTATSNHWLAIKLVGSSCDRNAVGARVKVTSGQTVLTGWCTSGEGYFGANDDLIRFGLGDQNMPMSIELFWPDGTQDQWKDVQVDQSLTLVQHASLD